MGKRGPKPKPTAMLKLSGSKWVNETRSGRDKEPAVEAAMPKCPTWLKDRRARAHWRKTVKSLMEIGVLAAIDGDALARLCMTYSRYIDAQAELDESGEVCLNNKGVPVSSPWSRVVESLAAQLLKLETEFGLTPSSRTRVHATEPKKLKDETRAVKESYFA